MTTRLPVGQMQSNCYLFWDEKTLETIIIDPGDTADFIIGKIQELELVPLAIIATHGHFDHVMAVLELKLAYNIPFYMHKEDEFLLDRMRDSAKHFVNFDPGPAPEVDIYLKDNSKLKIANCELVIVHTPGHTPGSVCLYSKKENTVFVGDLIFADGSTGRADFAYSDKAQMARSVEKVKKLPSGTIVYPGHGGEFVLGNYQHM